MGGDEEESSWPPWLKPLLRESFFGQCKLHVHSHKSKCNMYCINCMNGPLCSLCFSYHKDHHAIQIRRSSYHDVIRVSEIQKILDIGGIQTYIINSARVVFLNERPQPRPGKGVANTCEVCARSLLDFFRFCSLGCKMVGLSNIFKKRKKLKIMESESEYSCNNSNTTTTTTNIHYSSKSHHRIIDRVYGFTPSTPPPSSVNSRTTKRRKGIPHRAPLGGLIVQYYPYFT